MGSRFGAEGLWVDDVTNRRRGVLVSGRALRCEVSLAKALTCGDGHAEYWVGRMQCNNNLVVATHNDKDDETVQPKRPYSTSNYPSLFLFLSHGKGRIEDKKTVQKVPNIQHKEHRKHQKQQHRSQKRNSNLLIPLSPRLLCSLRIGV